MKLYNWQQEGPDLPAIEEMIGEGLRLVPSHIQASYIQDTYSEPSLMRRSTKEKAVLEMSERSAYDEGLIGTAEVFRNSDPDFVDRGLPDRLDAVPQIPALIDRGKDGVARFYHKFDEQAVNNRYVAGDYFTVADVTAPCSIDFAKGNEFDLPEDRPHVAKWYEEISNRASG